MRPDSGEGSFLSDDFLRELIAVGEVDIMVGVPTFNNVATVGHVVRGIQAGFAKYFPKDRTVVITADGGSTDGTLQKVRDAAIRDYAPLMASYPLRTVHQIAVPYHGIPGKGSALRMIFAAADLARAKAVAIVDPARRSLTPEWIESLLRPVYKDKLDFVAPLYRRHKFDGLLIKNLVHPLLRALYGRNVREPMAGDYGVSGRLARHYLQQDVWDSDVTRFGVDLWMTCTAISGGFRLGEAVLGAKIESMKKRPIGLAAILQQVVGSFFTCLERDQDFWLAEQVEQPIPVYGFEYDVALEAVRVSRKHMLELFRQGTHDLKPILQPVLSPQTLDQIDMLVDHGERGFRFADQLWVRTVYEFAASYHHSVIRRDHLLQALAPLYLGRAYSFVVEHQDTRKTERLEKSLEALCRTFVNEKPYLRKLWLRDE
jgi:glycosyltransferase involved in cell wall biosynthesis